MTTIGLTGGIGCGKSTVGRIFRDMGAELIDSDQVAREVVAPGTLAWNDLVQRFGRGILRSDDTIDRALLASLAFSGPEATRALNEATHPRIIREIRERLDRLRQDGRLRVVVVEVPLLFETDTAVELVDLTVTVSAAKETCLRRIEESGRLSRQEAEQRMSRQMPQKEKESRADYIIDNDGSLEDTRRQVEKIWAAVEAASSRK